MKSRWWSFGGTLVSVLCSALSACSNRPDELVRAGEKLEPPARRVPDSLGARADAETLRGALKQRLSRSSQGLRIERTAAGTRSMPLDGRFRSVHVATIDENGKKHIDCVTTNGELADVLKQGGRR